MVFKIERVCIINSVTNPSKTICCVVGKLAITNTIYENSIYLPIPSIWGHRAGNPYQNPEDEKFIHQAVKNLLMEKKEIYYKAIAT